MASKLFFNTNWFEADCPDFLQPSKWQIKTFYTVHCSSTVFLHGRLHKHSSMHLSRLQMAHFRWKYGFHKTCKKSYWDFCRNGQNNRNRPSKENSKHIVTLHRPNMSDENMAFIKLARIGTKTRISWKINGAFQIVPAGRNQKLL